MIPEGISLQAVAVPVTLLITASLALLVGVFNRASRLGGSIAILGLTVAAGFGVFDLLQRGSATQNYFGLQWHAGPVATAIALTILLGALLSLLIGWNAAGAYGVERPEYETLVVLATLGGVVMAHAGDFIVLLLGLEILSLSVYALAAWNPRASEEEAGMKYFLLGAFASAILIYGMALTYGATGSFAFDTIGASLGSENVGLLAVAGSLLILIGLAFKMSFAPFHQWAPDVYVGASMPVTAFMSLVVKAAAFGAALRVVTAAWPNVDGVVLQGLAVLIAATLVVGNFGALVQPTVKRILAYSAVAHAGYLGLGLLAAHQGVVGANAVAWYLLAYTAMTAGAFAVAYAVSGDDAAADEVDRWRGLGAAKPGAAIAMTLFLASLAGIPPLAGFFGKFLVIQAAFDAGWVWLAVLALVSAVVAVLYYGRIVIAIWRDGRLGRDVTLPARLRLAVVVSVVLVVAFAGLPAL